MSFRSVFKAVVIALALILAAFLLNRARPRAETDQPSADFASATGKGVPSVMMRALRTRWSTNRR